MSGELGTTARAGPCVRETAVNNSIFLGLVRGLLVLHALEWTTEESKMTLKSLCIISKKENLLKEFATIVNNLITTKYFSVQERFLKVAL